jgi:hypothetical protein
MKPDEKVFLAYLLGTVRDEDGWGTFPYDYSVGEQHPVRAYSAMPPKRKWYILEKWARRGIYDYGVSVELGWFPNVDAARDLLDSNLA